jgi:putative mRNA 3-end processing factor
MVKLSFLGGAREVGRSANLIDTGSERILLDYGIKIDTKPTQYPKQIKGKLDGILLSHAHLDHTGAVPVLFHQGQKCSVYGMNVTKPLCRMLFYDSHKIARLEGEKERYTKTDITTTMKKFKQIQYRKPFSIGKTTVTAFDAGHIPGSVLYLLETNGKRILLASDFNVSDTRLINGADIDIPPVDVLMTESTYSQREHPNRQKQERVLIDNIQGALANEGVALVACFAIARTQEILLILDEYELKEKIYIDGMAKKSTKIINQYPDLQKEYNQVSKAMRRLGVKPITNSVMRKKIIKEPCIIVTTSGMLSGGPISYYIENLWDRENCSLSMTGFQVPGTEGDILLETGHYIHGELDLPIKMNVQKFDFSSHTSHSELLRFIKKMNPEKIFCVHGDDTEGFAEELREKKFDAVAPKFDESFSV